MEFLRTVCCSLMSMCLEKLGPGLIHCIMHYRLTYSTLDGRRRKTIAIIIYQFMRKNECPSLSSYVDFVKFQACFK